MAGDGPVYSTVDKLHIVSRRSGFAMGGQLIDRTMLTHGMIQARSQGLAYEEAAGLLVPPLLARARHEMDAAGIKAQQFVVYWSVETSLDRCTMARHKLPSGSRKGVLGFDLMAPDVTPGFSSKLD